MSPLLFIFAIEHFAMSIHQSAEIAGMTIGKTLHHLSLFADNIVVFLTNL